MAHVPCTDPEAVVRESFWLAYQACGGAFGMGVYQATDDATRDTVWANVRSAGDYPGRAVKADAAKPGKAYGDYVFGRMMKLGLSWDAAGVTVPDVAPRPDYQSWCRVYPTYAALVHAAVKASAPTAAEAR